MDKLLGCKQILVRVISVYQKYCASVKCTMLNITPCNMHFMWPDHKLKKKIQQPIYYFVPIIYRGT